MFGKHFAQMYTGSMFGKPAIVFAVWGYVISNMRPARKDDKNSECFVEVNPALLAATFATSVDGVHEALRVLESPDPASRTKSDDGRRIVLLDAERGNGPMQYRVVNGSKYRQIRDEETRRAQNREAQQRSRDRKKLTKLTNADSQHCQPPSAQVEVEGRSRRRSKKTPPATRVAGEGELWNQSAAFDEFWTELLANRVPNPVHKGAALKAFEKRVTSAELFAAVKRALGQYRQSPRVQRGFVQDASTWLGDWEQWAQSENSATVIDTLGYDRETWASMFPGRPYGHKRDCPCEKCVELRGERGAAGRKQTSRSDGAEQPKPTARDFGMRTIEDVRAARMNAIERAAMVDVIDQQLARGSDAGTSTVWGSRSSGESVPVEGTTRPPRGEEAV